MYLKTVKQIPLPYRYSLQLFGTVTEKSPKPVQLLFYFYPHHIVHNFSEFVHTGTVLLFHDVIREFVFLTFVNIFQIVFFFAV
jgi:hypothetical protein